MTSGPALPCPKCQRSLEPLSWHSDHAGSCRRCGVDFEFTGFPALTASRVHVGPKAVLAAEHATCFFHAENQAETVCASCGRFLCTVCAIEFNQRKLCPACVASANNTEPEAVGQRTLHDGIALSLALVPMLIWPITFVTAPTALGFVIYGWRKPRSLVAGGRSKLIWAGILSLLQIAGWLVLLVFFLTRKR
jgi:hypothetical protein